MPCTIRLHCLVSALSVSIVIENPLVETALADTHGNGISLANIQDRLALMFGEAATLRTGIVDQHYRVKLVIPRPPPVSDNTGASA
jgi:two-component system sensor histidine kinase AlgZ